jgi:hypothetical protein
MSLQDFKAILELPSWSKDVVVWAGSRNTLDQMLEGMNKLEIDLLDLFPDNEVLPVGQEDRAELLDRKLDKHLQTLKPKGTARVVLRVRNAALLARYGVGLQRFYDWFAGSRSLTVLEVGQLRPIALPSHCAGIIEFDSNRLVAYFKPLLSRPDRLFVETI